MNTDLAWTRWGAMDPYYGVLADNRFRKESLDQNRNAFFDTGELYVEGLLERVDKIFGPLKRRSVIDFGCGVGRLTIPLAKRFSEAVGIDISSPMLAEARQNAEKIGQRNLLFTKSDATLSDIGGQYDLVNSYIVFQHIPPVRGMKILRHLVRKVAEGGVASIHVCLSQTGGRLLEAKNIVQSRIPGINRVLNIYRRRPINEPVMQMNTYDLTIITQVIRDEGFGSMFVETEQHGNFLTATITAVRDKVSCSFSNKNYTEVD